MRHFVAGFTVMLFLSVVSPVPAEVYLVFCVAVLVGASLLFMKES